MHPAHTFHVTPKLPKNLERLRDIIYNLHWTWNHEAIDLFRRLDQDLFKKVGQNPVKLIAQVSQERLKEASEDDGFLSHLERVWLDFEVYQSEKTWYKSTYDNHEDLKIVYFSAEFGLHESIPVYSGGLGILAGDYLKAVSDLGVPMVGVGLMYQKGYFTQYLNAEGWQGEKYPETDLFHTPVRLLRNEDETPLEFELRVGPRDVKVHIWLAKVGRVNLYLLDTNVVANHPDDRSITENLYGGDTETRVKQEIVLGVGGIQAMELLGIKGSIYHMNEGHSAFMALERIRMLMEKQHMSFDEAREAARAGNVFTTHTPVPAGIDRFGLDLVEKYFSDYWPTLGIDKTRFFELGGVGSQGNETSFNMAILAIRLSAYTNGVSDLHAKVSQDMWHYLWPQFPKYEAPIYPIRNAIHARSWIAQDISMLLDRYLGAKWEEDPTNRNMWKRVQQISTEEFWRTRERQRARLVEFARDRLAQQFKQRDETHTVIERAKDVLDIQALTIGFARRFATYKRGSLLMSDKERLKRILNNPNMPVQLIFAGKAHPQDNPGKQVIRDIIHFAREEEVRNKIVFLEDYDIGVARKMVQGCDIWLNNPRPPKEASGTSGMKAAVNGVIHVSTLDGWWADIFTPEIGWAIGAGEKYEGSVFQTDDMEEYQDKVESQALYDLLENEIVPLFYKRDRAGVPRGWVQKVLKMMEVVCPEYITSNMVFNYTSKAYLPCHERATRLAEDSYKRSRDLIKWEKRIHTSWRDVKILQVESEYIKNLTVGNTLPIRATVHLGKLRHSDVKVQVFMGTLAGDRELKNGSGIDLNYFHDVESDKALFVGDIPCDTSGNHGFSIRVLPFHEDMNSPLDLGVVCWE